ncbi:MAG: ABC transporter permease subunit [Comamonas sp.]
MNDFDFKAIIDAAPYLFLSGLKFTLLLTLTSAVGGVILGTLLATARLYGRRWIAWPAAIYVNLFRSLPLVLVIFLLYFILPYALQWVMQSDRPITLGATGSAFVTFILFEAAYFSEIIRAGVKSVGHGQYAAGCALGLTHSQAVRKVILPQALRNMLPVLLTQMIIIFQETALVYVLSLTDFLGAATKIAQRDNRLVEMYVLVAIVFFIISFSASQGVRLLRARLGA